MYQAGKAYLFLTVTHYFTGRIVDISPTEFVLEDCAWIPETGRLSECFAKHTVQECEPLPDGWILSRGTIVGAGPWTGKLPDKVK